MPISRQQKGKERALVSRDEGPGGAEGIVLSLDQVGSGVYDVAYTLPMKFSNSNQQFSLQVDTGSSDLWVASTSCSTSSCKQTNGRLYNPSGSRATGVDFTIPYLQGLAAGPVVWDSVSVGGYTIDNQALAAANNVQDEPLGPQFSGILGLALPLNSIIAQDITPVTNNEPDGAAWASNLFSITPAELAPASRFLSLSLSRPGSNQIPSLLGIGRHPSALVPDPSKVQYSSLVSDRAGILFWKVSVRAITVYVNGEKKVVQVGRSASGAVFPSAVLDSGVPLILTTSTIANAIYGAIGIVPAKDGMYYVPCTTPLNLTMTIDNRSEIPLHPLDLTAEPPEDNNADFCVGLIQAADQELSRPDSSIGDMILGVPFMRNVYTVMAYTTPNADGSFTPLDPSNNTDGGLSQLIRPRLGLMPLTNPTQALSEFNTVRVLNQPISTSAPTTGTGGTNSSNTVNLGGKKLSVGIVVLIGLSAFIGLCGILFAARWIFMRRRFRKAQMAMERGDDAFVGMDKKAAFMLARRTPGTVGPAGAGALSEDELREIRYSEYMRKERESTVGSERTQVDIGAGGYVGGKKERKVSDEGDEFGFKPTRVSDSRDDDEVWDPRTGTAWGDETLVGARHKAMDSAGGGGEAVVPLVADQDRLSPPSSPEQAFFPHRRDYSDAEPASLHRANVPSVDVPLLAAHHQQRHLQEDNGDNETSGIPSAYVSHDAALPYPPSLPPNFPQLHDDQQHDSDDLGQFGRIEAMSMAGIGTASRTSKISRVDSSVFNRDSIFNRDSLMSMNTVGTAVGAGAGDSHTTARHIVHPTTSLTQHPPTTS